MLKELKEQVLEANLDLQRYGLVSLTWGNVSGIARSEGKFVIKPSGVDYSHLKPADMVVVDLNGAVVEGHLRPSSDTPTHSAIYRAFTTIGGIAHSHSLYAAMFAQANAEIPCYGTTHADHFHGTIPVTRQLTEEEVIADYEGNTGTVIIERFSGIDPSAMPGILVAGHGPFAFGQDARDAARNAFILEQVARMAYGSLQLNRSLPELPAYIVNKHYHRKHGPDSYYGQKK